MSSPPLRILIHASAALSEHLSALGHQPEPLRLDEAGVRLPADSNSFACLLLDGREPGAQALIEQLGRDAMAPPLLVLASEPCEPQLWQAFEQGLINDLIPAPSLAQSLARALVRLRREALSLPQLSQQKNKALSQLYHQLQGPVTALEGYLEILQSESLPPESVSQILGQLQNCVLRLRQHFNSLHLLSLVSERPAQLKPRPYLFHQLIEEFRQDFVQMQAASGFELQPDAQDELVLSDPHLMLHLLSAIADLAQRCGKGMGLSLQTANLSAERLLARTRFPLDQGQFQISFLPSEDSLPSGFLQVTIQLRGVRDELYQTLLELLAPEQQAQTPHEPELLLGAWLLRQLLKAMQSWLYLEQQAGFGLLFSFVLPLHQLPASPPA